MLLLLSTHWFACIMGLEAALHSNPDDTWVGSNMYDLCGHEDALGTYNVSVHAPGPLPGCEAMSIGSFYLAAVSMSLMIITATGGTDAYPSARSDYETLLVMTLVLLGAALWTMILAAFVDVAANGTPAALSTSALSVPLSACALRARPPPKMHDCQLGLEFRLVMPNSA